MQNNNNALPNGNNANPSVNEATFIPTILQPILGGQQHTPEFQMNLHNMANYINGNPSYNQQTKEGAVNALHTIGLNPQNTSYLANLLGVQPNINNNAGPGMGL